jgi:hypothetical protein
MKKKFKKGLIDALTKEEEKLRKNPNPTKITEGRCTYL